MSIYKKRPCLSTLVFFSLLVSGCGEELKGELVMEGFDSGPQVKITLHSQLELDFPLDPDPQLQTADTDELGESDNKFIAGVERIQRQNRGFNELWDDSTTHG